jgi:hypothetical protein
MSATRFSPKTSGNPPRTVAPSVAQIMAQAGKAVGHAVSSSFQKTDSKGRTGPVKASATYQPTQARPLNFSPVISQSASSVGVVPVKPSPPAAAGPPASQPSDPIVEEPVADATTAFEEVVEPVAEVSEPEVAPPGPKSAASSQTRVFLDSLLSKPSGVGPSDHSALLVPALYYELKDYVKCEFTVDMADGAVIASSEVVPLLVAGLTLDADMWSLYFASILASLSVVEATVSAIPGWPFVVGNLKSLVYTAPAQEWMYFETFLQSFGFSFEYDRRFYNTEYNFPTALLWLYACYRCSSSSRVVTRVGGDRLLLQYLRESLVATQSAKRQKQQKAAGAQGTKKAK